MSIIIDTNFYVALINSRDNYHYRALELFKSLVKGDWGFRITSDYVLDETITTVWGRTREKKIVKNAFRLFKGEIPLAHLISVPSELLGSTWEIFMKYATPRKPLSFTDCSLIAIAFDRNVEFILSFDKEFDGILTRVF